MTRECDVVVVGAGVGGLVAAEHLHNAGFTVQVLESRERVGGRTLSIPVDGGVIDLGATWFWPGEDQALGLAQRLGLPIFQQAIDGDVMLDATGSVVRRISGNPIDVQAFRFAEGAQGLARRLRARLPDDAVKLKERVVRIDHTSSEQIIVTSERNTYRCEYVVLALPPSLAVSSIAFDPGLPPDLGAAAHTTAVWMGQAVKAVAVYNAPFWRDLGLAGAAVSYRGPFKEFHDASGRDGIPAAIFGFANSTDFQGASGELINATFVDQLIQLFGPRASSPTQVVSKNWSAAQATVPTHQVTSPGTPATFGHPMFRAPTVDRIQWASTETATSYAGHIEGAIRAARRSAEDILHARTHNERAAR